MEELSTSQRASKFETPFTEKTPFEKKLATEKMPVPKKKSGVDIDQPIQTSSQFHDQVHKLVKVFSRPLGKSTPQLILF